MSIPAIGTLVVFGIGLLVLVVEILQYLNVYIQAVVSGADVSFLELLGMRLRKVNAMSIVNARVQARRAGLQISTREMEAHVVAGGDLERVISEMIVAQKAGIDLTWETATGDDLARRARQGFDILQRQSTLRAESVKR